MRLFRKYRVRKKTLTGVSRTTLTRFKTLLGFGVRKKKKDLPWMLYVSFFGSIIVLISRLIMLFPACTVDKMDESGKPHSGKQVAAQITTGDLTDNGIEVVIRTDTTSFPAPSEERIIGITNGELFELEGVEQNTPAIITFMDNTSRTATVNASGQIRGDNSEINLTVQSLSLNGEAPVLIGRLGCETIHLKFNNGALVHRNAANGAIPIGTYAELQLINTATDALAANYIQESDINLMGKPWTPVGRGNNASNCFTGTYDGNCRTINGLYINDPSLDYAGLFGCIGATDVAGEVKNTGVSGNVTGREWIGGIAGYVNPGRIENCFSAVDVTGGGATTSAGNRVGGIAGQLYMGSAIVNCYSTGKITGIQHVGGITGLLNSNNGTNLSVVENCYATGAVSGKISVGGLVGQVQTGGVVWNSVALNPYVYSEPSTTSQYPVARVAVRIAASNYSVNNYAWGGMGTNHGASFMLGTHAAKHDVHNGFDGVSAPAATFRTAAFWTSNSTSSTTPRTGWDTSIWSITDGKLPGLFNKPVELPNHLR